MNIKINKALRNLSTDELMEAHKALHDKRKKFTTVDGVKQQINVNSKTNRQVQFKHVLLTSQELNKDNPLSILASNGEKITWGINKFTWFAIYDNTIYNNREDLMNYLSSTNRI